MTKTAYVVYRNSMNSNYNSYSLNRALEKRGFDVKFFPIEGVSFKPRHDSATLYYKNCNPNDFDLVRGDVVDTLEKRDICVFAEPIFFMPESSNSIHFLLVNKIKQLADLFINDVDPHWHASNKIMMYNALKSASVSILNTKVLSEDSDDYMLREVEQVGGFPVILKDPVSALGRGVYRCNTLEELKTRRAEIAAKNKSSLVVIQELHDTCGVIVCARVVGDRVWPRFTIGSPYIDDVFKSNIGVDRAYFAHSRNEELEQMCVAATKALKLDTARVDLFVTDDGYKVCEVNSIGSILGADITFNTDIGLEIVDHAIKKSIEQ